MYSAYDGLNNLQGGSGMWGWAIQELRGDAEYIRVLLEPVGGISPIRTWMVMPFDEHRVARGLESRYAGVVDGKISILERPRSFLLSAERSKLRISPSVRRCATSSSNKASAGVRDGSIR